MPITPGTSLRRLSQREFGEVAFEVMKHVFAIHKELGRFFDERIYKQALVECMPNVRLEVPVDISFESFQKRCFLDVLVADGAVFEFKAVDKLVGRHRAQLLNYLLLCELAHGKLVNVRATDVEHEFVNTNWRREARTGFAVNTANWIATINGASQFHDCLVAMLRDWGTGLEIALYEEAITHSLGGRNYVEANVSVNLNGKIVGQQCLRLIAPGVAFKITSLDNSLHDFETHTRRLLSHLDLQAIAWVNINIHEVTFTTLHR